MPTYEYICRACDHEFELFQQISEPVKKKCPKCGQLKLERLIGTGAGIIFKGSGFYQTDYRSESYRKAAEAEKGGGDKKKDAGKTKTPDTSATSPTKDSGTSKPSKKDSPAAE